MNMALIEGNWKQFKGNIRLQWGRLCGNPLDVIIGKREMLAGKIQEICDLAKDGTGKQI
ncbi:MAG: CsbD family protein [Candidatus Nitrotoga sp.]